MSITKLTMIRPMGLPQLVPYGDRPGTAAIAWAVFEKLPINKPFIVSIHQARNVDHFNLFWALAAKVADFHPTFLDADDAVRWAKRRLGLFDTFNEKDGRIWCTYRSLAVESMDQTEFKKFFDQCLDEWAKEIGTDPEELLK